MLLDITHAHPTVGHHTCTSYCWTSHMHILLLDITHPTVGHHTCTSYCWTSHILLLDITRAHPTVGHHTSYCWTSHMHILLFTILYSWVHTCVLYNRSSWQNILCTLISENSKTVCMQPPNTNYKYLFNYLTTVYWSFTIQWMILHKYNRNQTYNYISRVKCSITVNCLCFPS